MKLVGRAAWDPTVIRDLGVKKGSRFLVLVIDEDSEPAFAEELKVIGKTQHDRFLAALQKWEALPPAERPTRPTYQDGLVDLQLDLRIFYNARSIDANALYWSVLAMEASFLNGTPAYRSGYWSKKLPGVVITPKQIHEDDLETYCEKSYLDVPEKDVFTMRRLIEQGMGRVHHIDPLPKGAARLWIWKTTRYMNSKEFNEWTKRKVYAIRDEGSLLKTDVPEFIALKNDFKDLLVGKKKERRE